MGRGYAAICGYYKWKNEHDCGQWPSQETCLQIYGIGIFQSKYDATDAKDNYAILNEWIEQLLEPFMVQLGKNSGDKALAKDWIFLVN